MPLLITPACSSLAASTNVRRGPETAGAAETSSKDVRIPHDLGSAAANSDDARRSEALGGQRAGSIKQAKEWLLQPDKLRPSPKHYKNM